MTTKESEEFYISIGVKKVNVSEWTYLDNSYDVVFDEDTSISEGKDLVLPTGEEVYISGNVVPVEYYFNVMKVMSSRRLIIAPYSIEWNLEPLERGFSFHHKNETLNYIEKMTKKTELSGFCISPEDEAKINYAKVEKLTDAQLQKEYMKLGKDVLVEMVINQSHIIDMLLEPSLRTYKMDITPKSTTT